VRVKISYGADIDEVPGEVRQLFSYISEKVKSLKTQSEHIEDALDEEEMDLTLPLIDKMRRTLALLDRRLSDIEMISTGYLNYKEGESDVSVRRSAMDPSGHTDVHKWTKTATPDVES
jgi:uncharacterized protein (UPF0305 family)